MIKKISKTLLSDLKRLGFKSRMFTDTPWLYSSKEHTRRTLWLEEIKMQFREEYGIIIEVCLSDEGKWYEDMFETPVELHVEVYEQDTPTYFESYEDALEDGIKRAVDCLQAGLN